MSTVLTFDYERTSGIRMTALRPILVSGDKAAHVFKINVLEDGKPYDLTGGSAAGYLIRSDEVSVPLTGEITGNVVSITLPQACYASPGHFTLAIRVTTDDEISTIFYGDGSVVRSSSDSVIDPEGVIPSLDELLAQIETMTKATAEAKTATTNAKTATTKANTATGKAETATTNAENAATKAENAAAFFDVLDASATTLDAGSSATAEWQTVSGKKTLILGIPKGDKGETGDVKNLTVCGKAPTDGNIALDASDVSAIATSEAESTVQKYAPVQSVNGQTGAVTIDVPTITTPTLYSTETEWNQSFTSSADSYSTIVSMTVPETGLYAISLCYSGSTAFSNRAFIDVGDNNRAGMPLSDTFPTVEVTTMRNLTKSNTLSGRVYTLAAGTYTYQFARLTAVLLAKT